MDGISPVDTGQSSDPWPGTRPAGTLSGLRSRTFRNDGWAAERSVSFKTHLWRAARAGPNALRARSILESLSSSVSLKSEDLACLKVEVVRRALEGFSF